MLKKKVILPGSMNNSSYLNCISVLRDGVAGRPLVYWFLVFSFVTAPVPSAGAMGQAGFYRIFYFVSFRKKLSKLNPPAVEKSWFVVVKFFCV